MENELLREIEKLREWTREIEELREGIKDLWLRYESLKKQLPNNLSSKEYETAIKEICEYIDV